MNNYSLKDKDLNYLRNGIKAKLPPDGYEMHPVEREQVTNDIIELIEVYRLKVERDARIDELKHIDDPVNVRVYWNGLKEIGERITDILRNENL